MKTVIVFREGQSGHYLKSITLDAGLHNVGFRMSENHKASSITLTHTDNYQEHMLQFDLVLRILPTKKIYSAIYNNFMKKLINEQYSSVALDNWQSNSVFWYDLSYYNIREYYDLITTDIQTNRYTNIIDFDRLLDKNYLSDILYKYFQIDFNDSRETVRKTYEGLQLSVELDQDRVNMEDIADVIQDQLLLENPWFFSYCIHKYELANNLTPQNRLWSINNIDQPPTKQLLLSLAAQYS
jgi:hypothetical protein